jgi:hypothetical protein
MEKNGNPNCVCQIPGFCFSSKATRQCGVPKRKGEEERGAFSAVIISLFPPFGFNIRLVMLLL